MQDQRQPIIAVFGSHENEPPGIAMALGATIVERGHILLTGGTGVPHPTRVSELALQGAAGQGPRIGVKRLTVGQPLGHAIQNGSLFIVNAALGHNRNALEACLCDGAIALSGNEGTISEAMFSLSLGKPVIFVGNSWMAYGFDSRQEPVGFPAMVDAVYQHFDTFDQWPAPLDDLFTMGDVLQRLNQHMVFRWLPSPQPAELQQTIHDSLDWLEQHVGQSRPGYFPPIAGYEQEVIPAYNAWVAGA
jgi:uncharacterized protein (TIGR00725 family)